MQASRFLFIKRIAFITAQRLQNNSRHTNLCELYSGSLKQRQETYIFIYHKVFVLLLILTISMNESKQSIFIYKLFYFTANSNKCLAYLNKSLYKVVKQFLLLIQCLSFRFMVELTIVHIRYPINASSQTYIWLEFSVTQNLQLSSLHIHRSSYAAVHKIGKVLENNVFSLIN